MREAIEGNDDDYTNDYQDDRIAKHEISEEDCRNVHEEQHVTLQKL